MRSSSLNEHLYIKNIIDNPNCLCGEIESTYHYLFNVRNILVSEIVFFESYFSLKYWTFDLRKIYYYLAVLTLISIQILLFLRQCINIFRKGNDFHKTQIHHVILYPECNLQFPFFSIPLIFFYLINVKWIEYVLMTIFNFSCVF
jgi:hypothetical protein